MKKRLNQKVEKILYQDAKESWTQDVNVPFDMY